MRGTCKQMFLRDLYITGCVSGYLRENFWLHFCCSAGEKVEPQRTRRENRGPRSPLSPRQMCTQKEWKTRVSDVKQRKRLRRRASFQPKRQNISFQRRSLWMSAFSPIRQHSIIISEVSPGNLPLVVPFLMGSVVKLSPWWCCGGYARFLPRSKYIPQPNDSSFPPSTLPPAPNHRRSFNSHYSSCHHLLLHYPDCTRPSITHWAPSQRINHSGW